MKEMGIMRTTSGWLALLLAAVFIMFPSTGWGQVGTNGDYSPADPVIPLPLYSSRPERGGFYAAPEFTFLRQTNTIKHQLISIRGFNDFDGSVQAAINAATGTTTPIIPGLFFGSGAPALDANQVSGPNSYQPGYGLTLGWRFGEGSFVEAVQFRWRHLVESKYSAVASTVAPTFLANFNLEDTFLFSPVFNFPNDFAGASQKIGISSPSTTSTSSASASFSSAAALTAFGLPIFITVTAPNGASATVPFTNISAAVAASTSGAVLVPQAPYGIWNGATTMTLSFVQRYDDYELIGRIPIYQSETCRCYGLAGPRTVAMWERFTWRTIDTTVTNPLPAATATATVTQGAITANGTSVTVPQPNISINASSGGAAVSSSLNGSTDPADTANYSNVVSNRLYGPMVGVGSEYYIGHGFAASLDLRAGGLIDIVKGIQKYERGDRLTSHKRAQDLFTFVPELDAMFNLTWYPIEGVELQFGYDFMAFFNTVASPRPVSFDFGGLDAPFEKGVFRMLDGFQASIAFVF